MTTAPDNSAMDLPTRQTLAGVRVAFCRLYRTHRQAVYDFLVSRDGVHTREELDDLVQEVFLRAWQGRQRFRGGASAKTYLFAIAKNLLREDRRAARRHICKPLNEGRTEPAAADDGGTGDRALEIQELACTLEAAIANLPPRQQEAIRQVVIEDRSIAEAARLSDCSPNTLSHRFRAALMQLHKALTLCSADKCPCGAPPHEQCPAECDGFKCLKNQFLHTS